MGLFMGGCGMRAASSGTFDATFGTPGLKRFGPSALRAAMSPRSGAGGGAFCSVSEEAWRVSPPCSRRQKAASYATLHRSVSGGDRGTNPGPSRHKALQ
jgi:hypothetical protein